MAPKRHRPYIGPGPKREKRKVAQDTVVPPSEVEKPEPQKEVGETCPKQSERTVLRAPRTGMNQRGAVAQDFLNAYSTAPLPEVVPLEPATNT